jgi:hypothetical protein
MLKAYLEKQKWFIAASGVVDISHDKAYWESKNASRQHPGTFHGRDPHELNIKVKAGLAVVEIKVKMDDAQGFEIRMGYGQEKRRGDGSLIIWYSNNVEGAAERVKRHYEQHGVPWAVSEEERLAKRKAEEIAKRKNKEEFEKAVGTSFGQEKWSNNMYYEQGTFGLSFRYEEVRGYDDLPTDVLGKKRVKLHNITGYFTVEEFKEFVEYIAQRPRLVAERLQGKVSSMNPKSGG